MYTGQIDVISNKATWASDVVELVDEDDGTTTDLTTISPLDIEVVIKDPDGCRRASATIANGKITIPGPGFQWRFEANDLRSLCAGTYKVGVKITIDGVATDVIDGSLAIVEGV